MTERVIKYGRVKRKGYAIRNNWFAMQVIGKLTIPKIPSDLDIHLHNIWKDVVLKET